MTDERHDDAWAGAATESAPAQIARRFQQASRPDRPDHIGPYKLLEQIGEGGMGVVYLAEQTEPIHRRVALKLIKLGMDTRQVMARFDAEREALALMNHPNVARVFDAGATEQGRPYFVMEYVEGVRLTAHCDRSGLSTEERLKLFMQICHAVQHAHQKGIIHRDLKPSNVLVTIVDDAPSVKVIDFGVAKATRQRLTEATVFTEQGQLVGTPAYMSPEQADPTGQDIDTRTDIYSLGVILYELLVGALPFDTKDLLEAGFTEIQRVIREVDPRKPSTRLSALGELRASARADTGQGDSTRTEVHGSQLDDIAHRRHTEPKTLIRQLRGDLDWIVMKCLEKDRTRRYDTANELALEIQRFLNYEPVLAGPPSATYRLRKFVRRNRGAVTGATIVAAVLILGVIGTTLGFVRAVVAQRNAVQRAEESEAVTQFLSDMLAAVDPSESGKDVLVREILDKSSKTIGERFADRPEIEARLRSTIGRSYFELGAYDQAEQHLPVALDMYRRLRGEDHLETIRSMNALAYLYYRQLRLDDALALNECTVAQARNFLGEENTETVRALRLNGALLQQTGRWEGGLVDLKKNTTEQLRRTLGEEHLDTLKSMHNLANLYRDIGRMNEAASLFEETLATHLRVFGEEHPNTLVTMRMFARTRFNLGYTHEAAASQEHILATSRRVLGEEHMQTLWETHFLASFYAELDRFAEARELFSQNLETFRRVFGDQSMQTAWAMDFYAGILVATGPEERRKENAEEALSLVERARPLLEKSTPLYPWSWLNTLARALDLTGDPEKAIEAQKKSLGLMPEVAAWRWEYEGRLATYYRSAGRVDDAARLARQRLETLRRLLERGGERPQVLNDYARDLLTIEAPDLRDPAAALSLAERACALAEERGTYGRWNFLDTLALAQHITGDTGKAIETQRRALGLIPPEYHQQRRQTEQKLAEYAAALAARVE